MSNVVYFALGVICYFLFAIYFQLRRAVQSLETIARNSFFGRTP